jgi:hypothetical protein
MKEEGEGEKKNKTKQIYRKRKRCPQKQNPTWT